MRQESTCSHSCVKCFQVFKDPWKNFPSMHRRQQVRVCRQSSSEIIFYVDQVDVIKEIARIRSHLNKENAVYKIT